MVEYTLKFVTKFSYVHVYLLGKLIKKVKKTVAKEKYLLAFKRSFSIFLKRMLACRGGGILFL